MVSHAFALGMDGGMSVYDGASDQFRSYDAYNNFSRGVAQASIFHQYSLRNGQLLVATSNGGVNLYDEGEPTIRFVGEVASPAMSLNHVSALAEGKDSSMVWVGLWGGGLLRWEASCNKWRQVGKELGVTESMITALEYDGHRLWVGTSQAGLFMESDSGFTQVSSIPEIKALTVFDGMLWVAAADGLGVIDVSGNSFRWISKDVQAVGFEVSQRGELFIAASDGGYVAAGKNVTPKRLFSGGVEDVASVAEGRAQLWVTKLGQLMLFDEDGKTLLTLPSWLKGEKCRSIFVDAQDRIWLVGRNKLYHIALNDDGKSISVIRYFDAHDGLDIQLFASGVHTALQGGYMLWGGLGGLVCVKEGEGLGNDFSPKPQLAGIRKGRAWLEPFEEGRSDWHHLEKLIFDVGDDISLRFTSDSYLKSAKNRYAYRIQGLQNTWMPFNAGNVIALGEIPTGDYMLEVKVANNDGIWSEVPLKLPLTIVGSGWSGATVAVLTGLLIAAIFGFLRIQKPKPAMESRVTTMAEEVVNVEKPKLSGQLKTIILHNLENDKMDAAFLAKAVGLSRTKLFSDLKAESGMTVAEYMLQVKMKKAVQLLNTSDLTLSEIAWQSGFSSLSHFSRSFKKLHGFQPSKYREQQRGDSM